MSLLTEEQIGDILDITNVCGSSDYAKKLNKWNSNQTNQHFEVNWKIAPKGAEEAILEIHWLDRKGDKFGWDVIAQYDRPAIAHPHATIMAKYAEVAQRRIDPWVEFEIYSESFGNWVALEVPTFFDSVLKYRHIGDAK